VTFMARKDSAVMKELFRHADLGQTHGRTRPRQNPSDLMQTALSEEIFLGMLCLERKRAERSGNRFLLVLLDLERAASAGRQAEFAQKVARAANVARRETDPAGWYKHESALGIIFTELSSHDSAAAIDTLLEKIHGALSSELNVQDLQLVDISMHLFPDEPSDGASDKSENPAFYPDLLHERRAKRIPLFLKRAIDVLGSITALVLVAPLFLLAAALVEFTSRGPVLFKQERIGQFGKSFTFLKFRSMYVNNDPKIHQEFMRRLISGAHNGEAERGEKPVFKMKNDPRVTPIGRFLRRTSLDELPQFFNVLKGDMSLVGPRPPVPYEYEEYDVWHRRRVLEIKPGLTGLWQVSGRSRVGFDDIVRLDLRYARGWSLWLDIKILAQTPSAVLLGDGAY